MVWGGLLGSDPLQQRFGERTEARALLDIWGHIGRGGGDGEAGVGRHRVRPMGLDIPGVSVRAGVSTVTQTGEAQRESRSSGQNPGGTPVLPLWSWLVIQS